MAEDDPLVPIERGIDEFFPNPEQVFFGLFIQRYAVSQARVDEYIIVRLVKQTKREQEFQVILRQDEGLPSDAPFHVACDSLRPPVGHIEHLVLLLDVII